MHPAATVSILEESKRVLLEIAGKHVLSDLLPLAVQGLAGLRSIALARIWLIRPTLPVDCKTCRLAHLCHNRERCLQLAASFGQSLDTSLPPWDQLNGTYRRFPIGVYKVGQIASQGKPLEVSDVHNEPNWAGNPEWLKAERIAAFAGHPLVHRGEVLGVLALFSREKLTPSCFDWLRMVADHLAAAIANARAHDEIESLKRQLEQENEYLREEVLETATYGDIVGKSPAIQAITQQIDLVAPTDSSVLILGESGTGKELVAREVHRRSRRASKPFIKVNCAAIPRDLYDSEFFGHAKGAFTSAIRDRAGRFELADGGTLFLDEIGEIPLDLQAKLLRVLQEGELERVGDDRTRRVDVRIIAATNRNLRKESEVGRFRPDLYFRLGVFPIEVPPLRNRVEDIPLLATEFIARLARKLGRQPVRIGVGDIEQLQHYHWPGNVRELQHVLERGCICAVGGRIRIELPQSGSSTEEAPISREEKILTDAEMRALEVRNIRRALKATHGKIYGPDGTAARLGMKPTTLASRMKSLKISKELSGGT